MICRANMMTQISGNSNNRPITFFFLESQVISSLFEDILSYKMLSWLAGQLHPGCAHMSQDYNPTSTEVFFFIHILEARMWGMDYD